MTAQPWERRLDRLRWRWLDRLRGADPKGSLVCRNPRLFLVRRRESILAEIAAHPDGDLHRQALAMAADLALAELRSGNLWELR